MHRVFPMKRKKNQIVKKKRISPLVRGSFSGFKITATQIGFADKISKYCTN